MKSNDTPKTQLQQVAKFGAFEHAWNCIRSNESHVMAYGAAGHRPDYDDMEDQTMTQAIKDLRPHLRAVAKRRIIWTPAGATWMLPFFSVDSATEGLMWLLNPAEGLFGVPEFLGSRIYLKLRIDAVIEMKRCLKASSEKSEQLSDEEAKRRFTHGLATALMNAHVRKGKIIDRTPLSQRKLGQILGVSQSTICRDIREYFGEGWLSDYRSALRDESGGGLFKGLFRHDGSVEAIDECDDDEEAKDEDGMSGVIA